MGDDIKMEVKDNRTPLKKTYAVSFQTDIIHEDNVNEISRNSFSTRRRRVLSK